MAWKIDRDYGDGGTDSSAVGTASLGPPLEGPTFGFRLLGDGEESPDYHGIADARAAEDREDGMDIEHGALYEACAWGQWYAGCTDLQVRGRDALAHGLTSRHYMDTHGLTDEDWVTIYG